MKAIFQREIRERLIEKWLTEHTKVPRDYSWHYVKGSIEAFLREDRREELSDYLTDMAEGGLDFADKNRRKRFSKEGYLGHTWAVICGLAKLALAITVISVADTKFQTVALCMLVLIYASVDSSFRISARNAWSMGFGMDYQFKQVFRTIKRGELADERRARIEAEQKAEKDFALDTVRYYIALGFHGVIWLYAISRLLLAAF